MTNREIDKEVAEKVMGWRWSKPDEQGAMYNHPNAIGFKPSTDISDAWLVVEKMIEKCFTHCDFRCITNNSWFVNFRKDSYSTGITVLEDTPSMAICLAALKAIRNGK